MSVKLERLEKFVTSLIINNANGKYNCYFDFRDEQYYAEIYYNEDWDSVINIFPAFDDCVSGKPFESTTLDADCTEDLLKEEIFDYLKRTYKIK